MDDKLLEQLLLDDPVEYLIQRRFKHELRVASMSPFEGVPVSPFDGGPVVDRMSAQAAIDAYRTELSKKTLEEILGLQNEERAKEAEELERRATARESRYFFNQVSARADCGFWCKLSFWKAEEAIALCFGRDPKKVTWDKVRPHIEVSAFARASEQVREIVLRAVAAGELTDPVKPSAFLEWAKMTGIQLDTDLLKAIQDHSGGDPTLAEAISAPLSEDTATTEPEEIERTLIAAEKRPIQERRTDLLKQFLVDKGIPESQWRPLKGWTRAELFDALRKFDEFKRITRATFDNFWDDQKVCRLPDPAKKGG